MFSEKLNKYCKSDVEKLNLFLNKWDKNYKINTKNIALFKTSVQKKWTNKQKNYFVKLFYHIRGHFHNFLWYMGNYAPSKEFKEIILKNISEEFGDDKLSHEQLYLLFSNSMKIAISNEFVNEETYLKFIKDFNKGHLEWLQKHDWESCFCAFSAYERLDNIDYENLINLVKNINPEADLKFFNVHARVEHFQTTLELVLKIYNKNPQKLENSFNFIAEHQMDMWNKLSEEMFKHV